jgi:hypothetical protein
MSLFIQLEHVADYVLRATRAAARDEFPETQRWIEGAAGSLTDASLLCAQAMHKP